MPTPEELRQAKEQDINYIVNPPSGNFAKRLRKEVNNRELNNFNRAMNANTNAVRYEQQPNPLPLIKRGGKRHKKTKRNNKRKNKTRRNK